MKESLTVSPEAHGMALDRFLALRFPDVPRTQIRALLRRGAVRVDGIVRNGGRPLRRFSLVEIDGGEEAWRERKSSEPAIEILLEAGPAVFVSKPAGISVAPERWDREAPNLLARMRASFAKREGPAGDASERPRLVHRLDRDTSGVLVLALTAEAERELRMQFEAREAEKVYLALVDGEVPGDEGTVDLPLGEDPRRPGRMVVDERGKDAFTLYRVAERYRGFTLLSVHPRTGRTHQIRVHLAARGFPLAVDPLYGRRDALLLSEIKSPYRRKPGRVERPLIARATLHASSLAVRIGGKRVEAQAPLPEDLERTLQRMRRYRGREASRATRPA